MDIYRSTIRLVSRGGVALKSSIEPIIIFGGWLLGDEAKLLLGRLLPNSWLTEGCNVDIYRSTIRLVSRGGVDLKSSIEPIIIFGGWLLGKVPDLFMSLREDPDLLIDESITASERSCFDLLICTACLTYKSTMCLNSRMRLARLAQRS